MPPALACVVRIVFSCGLCAAVAACDSEQPKDRSRTTDADAQSAQTDGAIVDSLDAGAADAGDLDARTDASRDDASHLDASAFDAGALDANVDAAHGDAMVPQLCTAVAPAACPTPAPRYADVAPIIAQRCAGCHAPNWTGPWPLDTYGHVSDWQDSIRAKLLDCSMPPPDAGVPLPQDESQVILTWIRCGLPM